MATKKFYFRPGWEKDQFNAVIGGIPGSTGNSGTGYSWLVESSDWNVPTGSYVAPASNHGWTVGTNDPGKYWWWSVVGMAVSSSFVATELPNGTTTPQPSGVGGPNCLRTVKPLTGVFASGTWNFQLGVIRGQGVNDHSGRIRFRLWKTNFSPAGSGQWTLVSNTNAVSTQATNITNTTMQTISASIDLSEVTLDDEFLAVQLAWETISKSSNSSTQIAVLGGNATFLETPDFTPNTQNKHYLNNITLKGGQWGELTNFGGTSRFPPAYSTSATGWTVGTTVADRYSGVQVNTKKSAASFGSTPLPSAAPANASSNAWRLSNRITGKFEAGQWTMSMGVIASALGGSQDGKMTYRLWKSPTMQGTINATELTSGIVEGTTVTDLTTSDEQLSTASFSLSEVQMNGEFLFFQPAWKVTGAGASSTCDVMVRFGSGSYLETPSFTEGKMFITAGTPIVRRASGSNFGLMTDGFGDFGANPPAGRSGWTVGTVSPTAYSTMVYSFEQSSSLFSGTPQPASAPVNATGDAFRICDALSGSFAAGDWYFRHYIKAQTAGSTADGRVHARIWKSYNADGSGAVEVTSGAVAGTTISNITTTGQYAQIVFSLGSVDLNNEYLFLQLAFEITDAGSTATDDAHYCFSMGEATTAPGAYLTTTEFTPGGSGGSESTSIFRWRIGDRNRDRRYSRGRR